MKGRTTDRICAPIAPKGEDAYTDEQLARQWNSIDWSEAYGQVIRIQTRIARAWKDGNKDLSKRLQHLLTNSFYAKCLAVRRVTSNKGRKTPGIDGVLWNSASSKMDAVLRLQPKGYRSKPLKRVLIPKKNGKKRKLGIPTITASASG